MKLFKSLTNLKKGMLISAFTMLFLFGFVNTADAKFWGGEEGCNTSTCGTFGYKTCWEYQYVFWIKIVIEEPHAEAC